MKWTWPTSIIALVLLLSACGAEEEANRFGPVVSSFDDVVGTEVTANSVVSLPCIPSRRDPVGVWVGVEVLAAGTTSGSYIIQLQQTDARLGSHPSGCSDPKLLLAQSVFLFDGETPVFASRETVTDNVTTLFFSLDGPTASDFDVVLLPTLEFAKGDSERETTIFGLIGRYSLS